MASVFPIRPSIDHTPRAASSVDLEDDESTNVLEALASGTARSILSALGSGPATASEIAEAVETSPQNAHYHLTKLKDAGLITDVGTWYSEKAKEMTVYAVTTERVELRVTGADDAGSSGDRSDATTDHNQLQVTSD